jgi:hypothetical protein
MDQMLEPTEILPPAVQAIYIHITICFDIGVLGLLCMRAISC